MAVENDEWTVDVWQIPKASRAQEVVDVLISKVEEGNAALLNFRPGEVGVTIDMIKPLIDGNKYLLLYIEKNEVLYISFQLRRKKGLRKRFFDLF